MKTTKQILITPFDQFKIRPLEWTFSEGDTYQAYEAKVPMGSYTVERVREDWEESSPWGEWSLKYCFDEYYDEDFESCDSLADGKRKAWENWVARIAPALIPVFP
jgi:hypothetical protein